MNYISKRNRIALLYVVVLTIGIAYVPRVIQLLSSDKAQIVVSAAEVSEIQSRISKQRTIKSFSKRSFWEKKSRFSIPPNKFNPNKYSKMDWMSLGLSEKQADVVLKFTSRGVFNNDELQRVFVIPDELFDMIKDSTFYDEKPIFENKKEYSKTEITKKPVSVEINSASADDLTKINGIGPAFAKWIVEYRSKLGGFTKKEQLLEVYKIDAEKYTLIEPYIRVDQAIIKPIKLNSISVEELKKHPYLNWNKANSIVKIRDRKGGFKSIYEIKESVLIDEECFENLKAYLSL